MGDISISISPIGLFDIAHFKLIVSSVKGYLRIMQNSELRIAIEQPRIIE